MITKKISLLTILFFVSYTIFAQTSGMGFNFQGYAIDPDGKALASTGVTVEFSITPGTFTEEHAVTTDAFGVFHAIVGNSSVAKNAEFKKLDFTKKNTIYSLKVRVKKTSGGTYTIIHEAQMNAVPYARFAFNGVPVGTIIAYAGDKNNIPDGWLLCDGASVAQADYTQLYAIIGGAWGTSGSSFNLPDLRGRFLRGVDENINGTASGNDPDASTRTAANTGGNTGNAVGSIQGYETKQHKHNVSDSGHAHSYQDMYWSEAISLVPSGSSSFDVPNTQAGSNAGDNDNVNWQYGRTTVSGNANIVESNYGGNETRPINAGVYYIIKY